jgi:hypothetical protein
MLDQRFQFHTVTGSFTGLTVAAILRGFTGIADAVPITCPGLHKPSPRGRFSKSLGHSPKSDKSPVFLLAPCLTPASNESNMAQILLHLLFLWIPVLAAQFSDSYPPCAVSIYRF